jgi:hypothetical protein
MFTHGEQLAHGEKLVAAAGKWAESKGFGLKKSIYAKTIAAAVSAVQDAGPEMLSFDEMRELIDVLSKVE